MVIKMVINNEEHILDIVCKPINVLSGIYSCKTPPALESSVNSDEFRHQHKFSAIINSIKCLQGIQSLPEIILLGHEGSNTRHIIEADNCQTTWSRKASGGSVSPVTTNTTTQTFLKTKTAKSYAKLVSFPSEYGAPCENSFSIF